MSVSIQTSHDWAVPGPLPLPCPAQREEWPTACGRHPGKRQHPRLSTLSPGEHTHQGGGFPYTIVVALYFLNPWTSYPWLHSANNVRVVWRRATQPVRYLVFKVLVIDSHTGAKKWKCLIRKGSNQGRLPLGLKPRGLRGLKPVLLSLRLLGDCHPLIGPSTTPESHLDNGSFGS